MMPRATLPTDWNFKGGAVTVGSTQERVLFQLLIKIISYGKVSVVNKMKVLPNKDTECRERPSGISKNGSLLSVVARGTAEMRESLASTNQPENMDLFENKYFRITRNLMFLIGRWPDYASRVKSFQTFFTCIVFITAFFVLISKFATTKFDIDLFVEVFPPLLIISMCFAKYCTTWIYSARMRKLIDYIRFDWRTIQCQDEMVILKKYANVMRLFGLFYTIAVVCAVLAFLAFYVAPCIISTLTQTNRSHNCKEPFAVEYFVDQDKYFYPILMHILVIIVVTHSICVATDLFFILVLLHACGTFSVLGYRLEHVFDSVSDCGKDVGDSGLSLLLYRKIAGCVQFHLHIKKYLRGVHSCYVYSYLIQLLFAVSMLTSLLLRLSDQLATNSDFSEIVGVSVHLSGVFFAIFINVLPGQILLNCSADLFERTYSGKWYVAPLAVRKSLIILLRKTMEPCGFSAANLVTASLPTFSAMIQTSVSYFTVLYSVRQAPRN